MARFAGAALAALIALPLAARADAPRSVTVPFTLDHNRMIVEAEIQRKDGGFAKAKLWVDSGSQYFFTSEALAKDLGLEPGGARGVEIPTPAAVRIGGMPVDFAGVASFVNKTRWQFNTMHNDGNLPAAVLRKYHVVFDYPARTLTLAAPGSLKPRGERSPAAVHPETGIVQMDGTLDGEARSFALDNGASFSFIPDHLLEKILTKHPEWPRVRGAVGCANIWGWLPDEGRWPTARVPEFRWGTWTIEQAALVGVPPIFSGTEDIGQWYSKKTAKPVDGFLGPNAYKDCRVEIVYTEPAVYFERTAPVDTHDMDIVGLTLKPLDDGRYEIVGIAEKDGAPVVTGVEAGDILLQAGDVAATGATMGAVVDAMRGRPGDVRALKLDRKGKIVTVEATVRRLL